MGPVRKRAELRSPADVDRWLQRTFRDAENRHAEYRMEADLRATETVTTSPSMARVRAPLEAGATDHRVHFRHRLKSGWVVFVTISAHGRNWNEAAENLERATIIYYGTRAAERWPLTLSEAERARALREHVVQMLAGAMSEVE